MKVRIIIADDYLAYIYNERFAVEEKRAFEWEELFRFSTIKLAKEYVEFLKHEHNRSCKIL